MIVPAEHRNPAISAISMKLVAMDVMKSEFNQKASIEDMKSSMAMNVETSALHVLNYMRPDFRRTFLGQVSDVVALLMRREVDSGPMEPTPQAPPQLWCGHCQAGGHTTQTCRRRHQRNNNSRRNWSLKELIAKEIRK